MSTVLAPAKTQPFRNWVGVKLGPLLIMRRLGSKVVDGERYYALWEALCMCGKTVQLDSACLARKSKSERAGRGVRCSLECKAGK